MSGTTGGDVGEEAGMGDGIKRAIAAAKATRAKPKKVVPVVVIEGSWNDPEMELDKRTYLPGITIRATCPKCGTKNKRDMTDSYLSYPKAGVPIETYEVCSKCEHEWTFKVILRVTLEVA